MTSKSTRQEIEEMIGRFPSWMEYPAEPASDHSWGIVRDLEFSEETELTPREKSLVSVGAAAAVNCPYCTYFDTEGARMNGVTEAELKEAVNLAADTKYFSTILHGNEADLDEFKAEVDEMIEYIEQQQAAADD